MSCLEILLREEMTVRISYFGMPSRHLGQSKAVRVTEFKAVTEFKERQSLSFKTQLGSLSIACNTFTKLT